MQAFQLNLWFKLSVLMIWLNVKNVLSTYSCKIAYIVVHGDILSGHCMLGPATYVRCPSNFVKEGTELQYIANRVNSSSTMFALTC